MPGLPTSRWSAGRPVRFCLIADDFAMTRGVSRSILDLLSAGRLSGTGTMTTMRHWPDLAGDLRSFDGQADLGLHVNLTLGAPLGPMAVVAPGGGLPPLGVLARLAFTGRLPGGEVEAEILRQIDAFAEHFGRLPDFIDGHQHVQVLPGVRGALLRAVAARYAGRTPPWLRDPSDTPGPIVTRGVAVGKALAISGLSLFWSRSLDRLGLETNRGFSGVSPFDPRRDFAADFARFLAVPGPRHLVMVHPGHVDAELERLDPVVETRPQEHGFLAGERFGEVLEAASLDLSRFADLDGAPVAEPAGA